ncbi:MAG: nucleotide exchange factor GrpE [Elusimicrobia bacterium]|nr:nucleotide exchange factor GrpE [Elusimicrobiota bacterium]
MSPDQAKAEETKEEPKAEAPKEEKENFYDQLVRLKAEFENYRKRVDREKPELMRFGRADVLLKLLPIFDLLHKAHEQIQADHAETELAKGMELIFKEFQKIFKEEGVTMMEPAGKPYDSSKQEVLGTVAKDGAEEGVVVDVLQNGFMVADRVLRTAKVRIAKKEA